MSENTQEGKTAPNLTLDPTDWASVRKLGHQMIDDMFDNLETLRDRPVWQPVPDDVKSSLQEDLPMQGKPLPEVYQDFKTNVLPFPTGNIHPRFWGWVMTNGTPTSMLADMLASGMNPHLAGYDQSASIVEKQLIDWLRQLMGFPETAGGLLVSGGTMANINGLAVARATKAEFDIRESGLQINDGPELTVYGSSETHSWIKKACELMGMGRRAFRAVGIDDQYRVDVEACRQLIEEDIAAGKKPFCILGTVGTVNTGAIDDIRALRTLADEFDLWLHIDGAYGSLVSLTEGYSALAAGQERADSIGFDLHKWGFMPYEIACVLVRDGGHQDQTFGQEAAYLSSQHRGLSVGTTFFADKGIQLSRGFRALKAWMTYKEHGFEKIGKIVAQNIEQAQHLGQQVEAHPQLDLLAEVTLNIVCFRFSAEGLDNESLNEMNQEILVRLQETGVAVPSQTILDGKFAVRVCITNHRTRYEDLDILVAAVVKEGLALLPIGK
jgi:aromatic-L-amino-acid decarboxylase